MKMVQYSRGLSLQSTVYGSRPLFLRRGRYVGLEPARLVKIAVSREVLKKGAWHNGVSKRWLLGMVACALLGGTILGSDDASAGKWRWCSQELAENVDTISVSVSIHKKKEEPEAFKVLFQAFALWFEAHHESFEKSDGADRGVDLCQEVVEELLAEVKKQGVDKVNGELKIDCR